MSLRLQKVHVSLGGEFYSLLYYKSRCSRNLHRKDGPAAIRTYGIDKELFFIDGRHLSKEEFTALRCK